MEDALKLPFIPMLASLLFLTSSCSWYRDLERSLVADDQKNQKRSTRPVAREQYDQLLVKYEELSKKYEELKENPNANKSSLTDELQKVQGENFANTAANTETVNVFPEKDAAVAASVTPTENVSSDVDAQLSLFRRGMALKASNAGEATKIFQQLETEGVPSVKVRAKYQIGEMLLARQQYDLALQVFEDIINKNASSGIVQDALRSAVVCSDKLGMQSKKEQYASVLNDVFETR
jgi:TolA-binding protein